MLTPLQRLLTSILKCVLCSFEKSFNYDENWFIHFCGYINLHCGEIHRHFGEIHCHCGEIHRDCLLLIGLGLLLTGTQVFAALPDAEEMFFAFSPNFPLLNKEELLWSFSAVLHFYLPSKVSINRQSFDHNHHHFL